MLAAAEGVPAWSIADVLMRLGAATAVGALVGLNRDLRDKPAGLRTHALVGLGSSLVVVSTLQVAAPVGAAEAEAFSRAVQGIITGIGFLGGGVILRDAEHRNVHGLTTAASIWLVACVGIACGAGYWVTAVAAVVLTFAVLLLGGPIEKALYRLLHDRPRGENRGLPPRGERGERG